MSLLRGRMGRKSSPPARTEGEHPRSKLIVDTVVTIDANLVLVVGWCESLAVAADLEIRVVSPGSGSSGAEPVPVLRQRRPDVSAALGIATTDLIGFVGCVATSGPQPRVLEFTSSHGEYWRIPVSPTGRSAELKELLNGAVASVDLARQVTSHVLPLVEHEVRLSPTPEVETIYQWPPEGLSAAALNIVIPVYGNFDYLRNQLLAFSRTSSTNLTISVVCDDPSITKDLLTWVRRYNAIYQVPLKLLAHDVNAGFAAACNTGAQAVDSDVTLLLNSDVLPTFEPADWARQLTAPLSAGAVMAAPALLFPDGSVQHAGMSMQESQDFIGFELPAHLWKGMPRTVLPRQPFPVPLLSGAALAISTSTFLDLGGMPTWLGKGDFEDVALSVAARRRGDLVVVPSVAWTHIEGASYNRSGESDVLVTLAKSQLYAAANGTTAPAVVE